MTATTAELTGAGFKEFRSAALQIPVGRTGTHEDIAHTAWFFASEGAGSVRARSC